MQAPDYRQLVNSQPVKVSLDIKHLINKKETHPEVAKQTCQAHIDENYSDWTQIYTDGSKDSEKSRTGAGCAVFNKKGELIEQDTVKIDHRLSIFTAEITAILRALAWIIKEKPVKTVILSDSLSVLTSLQSSQSKSRQDLVNTAIILTNKIYKQGIQLDYTWIPSHIGIIGNEKADELAKIGSIKGKLFRINLNKTDTKSMVKQIIKNEWRNRWNSVEAKRKKYNETFPNKITMYSKNRLQDVIFTRIRLATTGLKADTHKTDTKCDWCNNKETFEHAFFDTNCSRYKDEKLKLKNRLLRETNLKIIDRKALTSPPDLEFDTVKSIVLEFIMNTAYRYRI